MKSIVAATLFIVTCSLSALGQSDSRAGLLKELETKRAELGKLENRFLAPAPEDRAEYAVFLEQPDTGLIRLLPREVYDSYVNKKGPLTVRGGGAYYSFALKSHEYGNGTDIGFEMGYVQIGGFGGASYGMLARLDSVRLEEVSAEHPILRFLAEHNAAASEPAARIEQRRTSEGTTIDSMSYKRRWPVEVGATYVGRSINYDQSDVLVAFKIVRKDTDGSLIIAWKLLKKFPKTELIRSTASR